jgi:hypothetical protein
MKRILVAFALTVMFWACAKPAQRYAHPLTPADTVLRTFSFTYDMWGDGGSASGFGGWDYKDFAMRSDRYIIDSMVNDIGHPEWYKISSHVMQPLKGDRIRMGNEQYGSDPVPLIEVEKSKLNTH